MSEEQQKASATKIEVSAGEMTRKEDRSYRTYHSGGILEFDPMKDLNLPSSYQEVLTRFNKLQGDRAMESLN